MSQEAYNRFAPEMAPDGILLYESELVEPRGLSNGVRSHGIPSTRIAEELRRPMVANIVMVGFFAALVDVVGADAIRQSVRASVPAGTEVLNTAAFERGYSFGLELKAKQPATAAAASK